MAYWTIQCAQRYLAVLYDYLHEKMYGYHALQADETPVLVNKDGRPAGAKNYMWVYRTGRMYEDRQIILYEYQKTRNASHPREFLKKFEGICVTDGYQVYHTIGDEREDLAIHNFLIVFLPAIAYNIVAGRNTLYTHDIELVFKRYVISSIMRSPFRWLFYFII